MGVRGLRVIVLGLGACPRIRKYRAHGACESWGRVAAQRKIKARGGGNAGTFLTTSNAAIASEPTFWNREQECSELENEI
jgi:hypothetical protein